MSLHQRSLTGVILASWLAFVTLGCTVTPSQAPLAEEEDIEAQVLQTALIRNRARLEPKGGVVVPLNAEYDVAAAAGIRGQIEAVIRGMWFGLEFDYANVETTDPITRGSTQQEQLSADTENLMEYFDRYQLLLTWDYEIDTGSGPFYPTFRFGLGLGGVMVAPQEAPGNTLLDFDDFFTVVVQPRVGFRFPFHENVGAFFQANLNWSPEGQLSGDNGLTRENVDIGDKVEFSAIEIWGGLSFEW